MHKLTRLTVLIIVLTCLFHPISYSQSKITINMKEGEAKSYELSDLEKISFLNISGIENKGLDKHNLQLLNIMPNPFTDDITFSFSYDSPLSASIDVYDLLGNKIYSFGNTEFPGQNFVLKWNGIESEDKKIKNGTYFIVIHTESWVKAYKFNKIS